MRSLRSTHIGPLTVVSFAVLVSIGVAGCSTDDNYDSECVDIHTMQRVPDWQCNNSPDDWYGNVYDAHNHFGDMWYYLPESEPGSQVYTRVRGGSFSTPKSYSASRWGTSHGAKISRAGSVNANGSITRRSSSVTRGGFGLPSKSSSSTSKSGSTSGSRSSGS